ncbi:MAG: MBL fold metallo-hydrolase [Clostridiales bacterium]|nr:MBL fold metallo-hydrolase [Clostridiales bacterium]
MLITYHGHSEFLLETADGFRILTDPFNAATGYPMGTYEADVVTISHGHGDHTEVSKVLGNPVILREPGPHNLPHDVEIRGYHSFHDDHHGQQRGQNLCFVIQADGLTLAHMGDIGDLPDEVLAQALKKVDILMIPVGGHYTIDAQKAADIARSSGARVVIPMHYRTALGGYSVIATSEPFEQLMSPPAPAHYPLLRVTNGDLSEQPGCVVLDIQAP